MALKSYSLEWKVCNNSTHCHLTSVEYPEKVALEVRSGTTPALTVLPNAHRGFGFDTSLPRVDFKALRACFTAGEADLAKHVISKYKRSYMTVDHLYENIKNYGQEPPGRLSDPVYERVLLELEDQFDVKSKLDVLPLEEAVKHVPRNTSPGLPWLTLTPGLKKGEVLDKYYARIEEDWQNVESGNRRYPLPDCAAFGRTHIGSPDSNKVRNVWAVPLTVVAAEARFAHPIIEQLVQQKIGHNTAYGCEMMKGGMSWIHGQALKAKMSNPGVKFLMTDYSSFDSNVPAWLIRDCFKILRKKFNMTAKEANVFRRLVAYFINTPVQFADRRRVLKNHGVPSGSMFTNIIDTMVNFIQTRYCIYSLMAADPLFDIYFGDDGLIALPGENLVNLNDIASLAKEKFGAVINVKKSYWTHNLSNIHFLGYYNYFGTCYKELPGLIASLLYPQHNQDDWSYTMARAYGVLLASGGNRTIHHIVRTIWHMAKIKEGRVEHAEELVRTHPRMTRHLLQMGVDPEKVGIDLILRRENSIPENNCQKIVLGINLL